MYLAIGVKGMRRKTYAHGEKTETYKRLKEEHNRLIQKWKDDNKLNVGNIPQPNQTENTMECECGGHYTKYNKNHHVKQQNHLKFIEMKKTIEMKPNDASTHTTIHKKNRRVHADGFQFGLGGDGSGGEICEIIVPVGNKCVYETCVRCGREFPLTPIYFNTEYAGHSKTNDERESGKEVMSNTPFYGCRECTKNVSAVRSKIPDEYIRILLKSYPKLNKEWFVSQPKTCSISNIPLFQGQKENDSWTISVQNNKPGEEHTPENCCLIAREFNVQQQQAIPDLLEAWKEAFTLFANEFSKPSCTKELVSRFNVWYNNTPIQNGVTVPSEIINNNGKKIRNPEYSKLVNTKHLKAVLSLMLFNYKKQDKVSKRNPTIEPFDLTLEKLYQKMVQQKCKCHYTGIPFSFKRDTWNYFSLERLDNSKNHTLYNCVFVCRLFNTAGQLNEHKLLTALLSQQHVALSEQQKIKIQEKVSDIECGMNSSSSV